MMRGQPRRRTNSREWKGLVSGLGVEEPQGKAAVGICSEGNGS